MLPLSNRYLLTELPAVLPTQAIPAVRGLSHYCCSGNLSSRHITKEAALAEAPSLYSAAQQKLWLLFYLWAGRKPQWANGPKSRQGTGFAK